MIAQDTIRFDKQALINELAMYGAQFTGTAVNCPFHNDNNPSGGIYQSDDDGVWRFKCHGCGFIGDIYDVRARGQNRSVEEVLKECNPRTPQAQQPKTYPDFDSIINSIHGRIEAVYHYENPSTGYTSMSIVRFIDPATNKKSFRQISFNNGFIFKAPPKPWPLFNLTNIIQSDVVIVVEGEKCVEALKKYGFTATTSPCGAGKAEYADWSPLTGKKVILWPDCDANGENHMKQVRGILEKLDPKSQLYYLDPVHTLGLREKEDVADLIDEWESKGEQASVRQMIQAALDMAISVGCAGDVEALIEQTITGQRKAVEWPWRRFAKMTNALLPGTVTLICGDPGSAKSFFLVEALAFWHSQGYKVAAYELEEDRKYHLVRALAQYANNSNILDCDWIKDNPNESRQTVKQHAQSLDGLGQCIWEAPTQQCTTDQLAQWVEDRAKDGCRIIAIDPITAAEPSDKPWIADGKFMSRAKKVCVDYGVSLVLITHPKKGRQKAIGLDELAGGSAYQRFSQTIVWIEQHKGYVKKLVKTDMGRTEIDTNRSIYLVKTRNGKGQGFDLAYRFSGESLRFAEQGIIVEDDTK